MNLRLRTVIYQSKVDIENVPIYSCEGCGRSEVVPHVKPELTGLIGKLGVSLRSSSCFSRAIGSGFATESN